MSRKPMSKEEKRKKLLELFHESKEVFTLKEVEKDATKKKGIVQKTVEEVLKDATDEGLVNSEKIGTSVYFWSFPSEEYMKKKVEVDNLTKQKEEFIKTIEEMNAENEKLKKERGEEDGRESKIEELDQLKKRSDELKRQLDLYKDNDPEFLDKVAQQNEKAKDAVNRWTDAIFALKNYAKDRVQVEEAVLNKNLGIPNDFDYVE